MLLSEPSKLDTYRNRKSGFDLPWQCFQTNYIFRHACIWVAHKKIIKNHCSILIISTISFTSHSVLYIFLRCTYMSCFPDNMYTVLTPKPRACWIYKITSTFAFTKHEFQHSCTFFLSSFWGNSCIVSPLFYLDFNFHSYPIT